MTDTLRLFDLEPYGGNEPTPSETRASERLDRASKRLRDEPIVESLAPGYRYLRNNTGVLPYAHLIASMASSGATVTLCGKIGTQLTNEGVTQMIRCPECDLGQQLDFGS